MITNSSNARKGLKGQAHGKMRDLQQKNAADAALTADLAPLTEKQKGSWSNAAKTMYFARHEVWRTVRGRLLKPTGGVLEEQVIRKQQN
jgi:hypothetical protein